MSEQRQWYELRGEHGALEVLPQWMRLAGVDNADVIWIPAALAGNETMVAMCLVWGGHDPGVIEHGHVFVPLNRMQAAFPGLGESLSAIEAQVRWAQAHAPEPSRN